MRSLLTHQIIQKKKKLLLLLLLLIFSPSIRMIEKNIIFDDKKVKKGFYKN